jgi:hypothetical protein
MRAPARVAVVLLVASGCSSPDAVSEFKNVFPGVVARFDALAGQTPPRVHRAERNTPPALALARVVEAAREPDAVRPSAQADPGPRSTLPDTPAELSNVLVATSKETTIYARPSLKAPKIGYLRAGAIVSRDADSAGHEGCRGGFYGIAPEGYVCVGAGASLDARHDLARVALGRADRSATLPYVYGIAPNGGAPLYSRLPTAEEERAAEPGFDPHRARTTSFDSLPLDDVPWFLADGAPSIGTNGARFSRLAASLGTAIARSGFAFVSLFEASGRRFGLTADRAVVPLDRFTRVEPSRFHGLPLDEHQTLPVVFIRSKSASLYDGDPTAIGLRILRRLEFREAVSVSGKRVRVGENAYLETTDGQWIVDNNLVRVEPRKEPPSWAIRGRSWLDVSINHQSLVAYEGTRPVFVTLVSTGADGTGDPETTHSTIQGEFLLHTKHVTITMDSDAVGDEFDLRDVPYVQYFKEGYALHAAYWHDGFGTPRSHGCVNLSPLDARWLFSWTEPSVPSAWHGAMSAHGTLISIHP